MKAFFKHIGAFTIGFWAGCFYGGIMADDRARSGIMNLAEAVVGRMMS